MVYRKNISEEQAKTAIEHGEFTDDIVNSRAHVAIIMTQDWCPEWRMMQIWLKSLVKRKRPDDIDIDVYELEYDKLDSSDDFMRFKETTFGNSLIPYVRYYKDGKLIDESNYVKRDAFLSKLTG